MIAKTWEHLTCQVLNCKCQLLTIIFTCVQVLENQVMKDINNCWNMLKLFTPKGVKTWKAKSWIVQSYAIIVKTWKHGVAKNLACQVLNKKVFRFWNLVYQVLTIIFFWSCLGKPSHEDNIFFLGLSLKFGTPKGFFPSLE